MPANITIHKIVGGDTPGIKKMEIRDRVIK